MMFKNNKQQYENDDDISGSTEAATVAASNVSGQSFHSRERKSNPSEKNSGYGGVPLFDFGQSLSLSLCFFTLITTQCTTMASLLLVLTLQLRSCFSLYRCLQQQQQVPSPASLDVAAQRVLESCTYGALFRIFWTFRRPSL